MESRRDSFDLQLRGNMALVPQEVLLFGGSIRENIAYGRPARATMKSATPRRAHIASNSSTAFRKGSRRWLANAA